jgi:Secretion system C-terminal sorting domain
MLTKPSFYWTFIGLFAAMELNAAALTTIRSGSWYDPTIWDKGVMPTKWDKATIAVGNTVTVFGPYTDCDSLTINGFLDVGATNLTIGGRDLQIDVRAVRNTECIINGRLRINGDWSTQFKVYGNVKFNTGSIFEMPAGSMMIDGCAFTEALSVPAHKPLLDVTDAATFSSTGGVITMFNPHYHPNGITIKGAKRFYNVSFGNNITLANFACRNTSDFILSETDKPIFNVVRVAYLPNPNRQNKVVFNNVTMTGNLEMTSGILTGAGRLKIAGNILIGADGKIETDIECNHTWQQNISTYLSNTSAVIKGNVYVNNPDRVLLGIDVEIQNGTLKLIKGKLDLNEKTLILSRAPEGGSAESYVLSNNWAQKTGLLLIKNIGNQTIFPVGTVNSYVPVTVTGTGDFSVAVKPLLDYNSLGINVQWIINRLTSPLPATIQVQWNAHNEGATFKKIRPNCQLKCLQNNIWEPVSGLGATSQPNGLFFTKTIQNVDLFTTFTLQSSVPSYLLMNEVQNFNSSDQLRDNPSDVLIPSNQAATIGNSVLFPNPISNESFLNLRLEVDNQLDTKIMIFNTNQQLVYQHMFQSGNDLKIPVANLQTGVYSIQILNGGKQYHHKFVKN